MFICFSRVTTSCSRFLSDSCCCCSVATNWLMRCDSCAVGGRTSGRLGDGSVPDFFEAAPEVLEVFSSVFFVSSLSLVCWYCRYQDPPAATENRITAMARNRIVRVMANHLHTGHGQT